MHEYWFSSRILGFGFGWPLTWEGWLAMTGLFLALVASAYTNDLFLKRTKNDWRFWFSKAGIRFMLDLVILLGLFTVLFGDRVEGGMVWHWLE